MTAGYDPLRDEGLLFAERLIRHDIEVQHYHFDSLVHALSISQNLFQKRWKFCILGL